MDAKPKRKAAAERKPPVAKKPKLKNPLPLHSEPPPVEATDLASAKCSYHECHNRAKVVQSFGIFCNRHAVVFPCGFPGCREKAPTNGTRCAKHEGNMLQLDEALSVRSQSIPVCRTSGCFKNDQGRGYCRGHEKLMMATGQLPHAINKRRLNSAYTMCCYPNCNKHSQRNHLCRIHGNELIKQAEAVAHATGEPFDTVLGRLQKDLRQCTHPGCEKNAQRDRLCTTHFHMKGQAEKGLPKPDLDHNAKEKLLKFCSDDKCTQPVYCNWLCKQHYELKEKKSKHATPAAKSAKKKPVAKKPSAALNDTLFDLTPPMTGQASMVELLYPVNAAPPVAAKETPDMTPLQLDDPALGRKDVGYRPEATKYPPPNSFARPTFSQPRYPPMGYDYIPSHASSFGLNQQPPQQQHQDYVRQPQYHPSLPPPSTRVQLCSSTGCNREVTNGKGLCDVCVTVLTEVHAFSPTIHPFGTHQPSFEPSSHKQTSYLPWPSQPYFSYGEPKSDAGYFKPKAMCHFRGCHHGTKLDAAMCAEHAHTTFCAAPECEEILPAAGLCGLHAMDTTCCFEGCGQSRLTALACVEHELAPHCSHHQCAKLAVKPHAVCSLHLKGLGSCKLCLLYDVPCAMPPANENHALHNTLHASAHKLSF
ncbi:hypothetical protein ACHHYP_14608 [Achlya hypogyna]|uniref:Uncharacterized protein n=1 Tax=Achlya hypogyna TaxID=1202772 RepID=A0A1V9YCN3_ACHHY|nr:hypothetical protein ACHHYP_14608 [Achlya hypogyna]